jgi:RHS repeat-associated protein
MIEVATLSNGYAMYGYDAQNKRIWNWTGSTDQYGKNVSGYSVYYYGIKGERLGLYNFIVGYYAGSKSPVLENATTSNEIYFGARRLAPLDRLGSARSVNGGLASYYPFGEDKSTNPTGDAWRFGTYWRDSISGLDYADQRYFSGQLARFLSPDSFTDSAAPGHPGTWNRYAYVTGDPVNFGDPSGLDFTAAECIANPQLCDGSLGNVTPFGDGPPGSASNPDWGLPGGIFLWAAPLPDPFQRDSGGPAPTSPVAYVPKPTYLLVVGDCYFNGNGITRRRDYEVLDQFFQPLTYSVTIDEHISTVTPASNTIRGGGVGPRTPRTIPGTTFTTFIVTVAIPPPLTRSKHTGTSSIALMF